MAKLVSKTYGDALFELALEENKLDSFFEEALAIKEVFLVNSELVKLLNHPKIDKDEKIQVMENIFKGQTSQEFVGFLTLVVRKERHRDIVDILEYFMARVKEYKNIGVVNVTSATELSDEQKKLVEEKILSTTKYEKIETTFQKDEKLIGGMVIRIGDRVVDSSIRTKIEKLSRELYKIQLVEAE